MVAIIARNQTRDFARKRVRVDHPCAARTILARSLSPAEVTGLEFSWLEFGAGF